MGSYPPVPPADGHEPARTGDPVGPHGAAPEILSPVQADYHRDFGGQGFAPPPPRPRRRLMPAPATYTLVGINCAVFVLMLLAHVNAFNPSLDALLVWGANNAGLVIVAGQWWRIVSAMFVHGGFLHLALNMWCLWNLGLLAEPLMGSFGVAAAYVLTGAAGNLLSTLYNWVRFHNIDTGSILVGPAGVGASGAIFGIAGALIVLLKSSRLPVPPEELKKLRRSVIYFAVINLVIGVSIQVGTTALDAGFGIDNMAHLGGCASGLLLAVPMVPRIGSPRKTFNLRLRAALAMMVGILVLFGFYLSRLAH
jgi:rhomboid protease GluP